MKKRLQVIFAIVMASVVLFSQGSAVYAADALPSTPVWFTPTNAAVGTAINLNAFVYNNQSVSATVTVAFTTTTSTIGTVKATISTDSAKTLSVNWLMPASNTVVTATVTNAVGSSKQVLTPLLGPVGTVTVGTSILPTISSLSVGSSEFVAWLNPILASIEAFRVRNAALFAEQRDEYRAKVGLVPVPPSVAIIQPITPAPAVTTINPDGTYKQPQQGVAAAALGNPADYFIVLYSTAMASLFGSAIFFYIVLILFILLLLRFIVNLIFY